MKYILDTSAIVDAWTEQYQPSFLEDLWISLISLAEASDLGIPDAVFLELHDRDDELYRWCKKNEDSLSIVSDNSVQKVVKNLEKKYPQFKFSGLPRSKNFADLFVIALARVHHSSVVVHEKATGNLRGPKIPDICHNEGIECIRFHDIIIREHWRFSLIKS